MPCGTAWRYDGLNSLSCGISMAISFRFQVKEDEASQLKQQVVKAQAEHQGALEQIQIWQVQPGSAVTCRPAVGVSTLRIGAVGVRSLVRSGGVWPGPPGWLPAPTSKGAHTNPHSAG